MFTIEQIQALEEHISTGEAAERVGVTPATIRQWVRRGYLTAVNHADVGMKFYRVIDVLRCDRDRRLAAAEKMRATG